MGPALGIFTDKPGSNFQYLEGVSLGPGCLVHDAAKKAIEVKLPDVMLIDLFLTFKDPELQHQQDLGGIALLKFLRIKEVNNHIVLLSPWNLQQLLRMKPGYHILASKGITIAQYTYSSAVLRTHEGKPLDSAALANLAKEKAPSKERLRDYFKAGISLPKDERHNWAQWWGAECMRLMHNKAYPKEKITQPESILAKLTELKCAELKLVYSWPEDFDGPGLRERPLPEAKNVLYVDDNCDMGWKEVLASFIYGKVVQPVVVEDDPGVFKNGSLVSMKPVGAEVRSAFYDRVLGKLNLANYAYVLLDVRLFAEPHSTPDTELSGIELLRRMRAAYPTLPVVLLTATARADFFKAVEKIGLVEHWTKPSPEDSSKEDHLERSYIRLRRLLMNVAKQTKDALGMKFSATMNTIDQLGRVIGYAPSERTVHVNDEEACRELEKACDPKWMAADLVVVDTNFMLAREIHEVFPVLYFISLARQKNGRTPVHVINHVFDELALHQSRTAMGWNSVGNALVEKRRLGRTASVVLPFVTSWMDDGRVARYRYQHESYHAGAVTTYQTPNGATQPACNSSGKYWRGGSITADDVFVFELVPELRKNGGRSVLLFSNENDTEPNKISNRIGGDLSDEEKNRFIYVRIDALLSMAKAIDEQISRLSY